MAGPLIMHRLVHVCTSGPAPLSRHRDALVKLIKSRQQFRTFSLNYVTYNEKEGDSSDPSPLSTKLTSTHGLLLRRRRALSPLERISSLLPQDALTPEVMQLREQEPEEPQIQEVLATESAEKGQEAVHKDGDPCSHDASDPENEASLGTPATLPGERLIAFGELLMAEHLKVKKEKVKKEKVKKEKVYRKMFRLERGRRLDGKWGTILHDDIVGQPAGRILKIREEVLVFIRRPSLEDYVLLMKRGPSIAYPKDIIMMLMMMDVSGGDCVLECGSGSGAMSLFLSRAVGSRGSVVSLDVREDHQRRAMLNYESWRTSWRLGRGDEWPDNVQFYNADLCTASSLLAGRRFNSVALDMLNPHLVLPTVIPHMHHGTVCTVYLVNITQIAEVLEVIRSLKLPLLCECIIEAPVRDWLVSPALKKDCGFHVRKGPVLDKEQKDEEEEEETSEEVDEAERSPAFWGIPYIARPHPTQQSHTAFLVKLRKCSQ